jgi:hypothetical protein
LPEVFTCVSGQVEDGGEEPVSSYAEFEKLINARKVKILFL